MLYLVSDGKSQWFTDTRPTDKNGIHVIGEEESPKQEMHEASLSNLQTMYLMKGVNEHANSSY